jgi:diguanylate cyclase (GGDEF)-like protein
MRHAEIPADDDERLKTLHGFGILDTPAEAGYDDLLSIAAAICGAPMGTVSLVDADRQWFKARVGVQAQQTPRDIAFCAHTILDPGRVFEVTDAQADERFHDSPLVTGEPNIRFYAGAPLVASDGHAMGALCVMDSQPHQLTDAQRQALAALSRQVVALMELRAANAELSHHLGEREWYERELDARSAALREENAALASQSRTDPLTGLANRRGFGEVLAKALAAEAPFGFAIVDVDHFKDINDGWGHPYGDQVLLAVADALRATVDSGDTVARIGGEEFALLLPDCHGQGPVRIAEDARKAINKLAMQVPVTASVGVTSRRLGDTSRELYTRADAALYEAKRGGRNRVKSA